MGNISLTGSVNRQHKLWLFRTLVQHCKQQQWIAVRDNQGLIWSVNRCGDSEHFLVTSGFKAGDQEPQQQNLCDLQDEKILSSLNVVTLSWLATKLQLEIGKHFVN